MGGFDLVVNSARCAFSLEHLESRRLFSVVLQLTESDVNGFPITEVPILTGGQWTGGQIIVNPSGPRTRPTEPGVIPELYPYPLLVDAGNGRLIGGAGSGDGRGTVVFRLRPDGSFDPSFGGGDGIVKIADCGMLDQVIVQDDGKILLLTRGWEDGQSHWVYRLNADGSADPTFADGGRLRLPRTWPDQTWPMIAARPDGGFVVANVLTDWKHHWDSDSEPPSTIVVRSYNASGRGDRTFGDAGELRVESTVTFESVEALSVSESGVIDLTVGNWSQGSAKFYYDPANPPAEAPTLRALDPLNPKAEYQPFPARGPGGRTALLMGPFVVNWDGNGADDESWFHGGGVAVSVRGPDGALDESFGDHGHLMLPQSPHSESGDADLFFTPDGGIVEWHIINTDSPRNVEYQEPIGFSITRITPDGQLDLNFGGDGQIVLMFEFENYDISDEADWAINEPTTEGPDAPDAPEGEDVDAPDDSSTAGPSPVDEGDGWDWSNDAGAAPSGDGAVFADEDDTGLPGDSAGDPLWA